MRTQIKRLHDKCATRLKPVFRVLVRLPVHMDIWITDQIFLINLNNPLIGRTSIFGKIMALHASLWRAIKTLWNEARADYILYVYKKRNLIHYAKNGRGYANLDNLTKQDYLDLFSSLDSRLQLFLESYPTLVGYKNGDSFLDAGCGKGQNLKFIASKYPQSPYIGFDIDERCLQVARIGIDGNTNRSLRQGSILDFGFLKSLKDKSVDHVFICHVFSTLLESTVQQTRLVHQRIVDEFVRISRKSIMIIDEMSADKVFEVKIEQLTRAAIRENIASYFVRHRSIGEACILSHDNFRAVFFKSREQ